MKNGSPVLAVGSLKKVEALALTPLPNRKETGQHRWTVRPGWEKWNCEPKCMRCLFAVYIHMYTYPYTYTYKHTYVYAFSEY